MMKMGLRLNCPDIYRHVGSLGGVLNDVVSALLRRTAEQMLGKPRKRAITPHGGINLGLLVGKPQLDEFFDRGPVLVNDGIDFDHHRLQPRIAQCLPGPRDDLVLKPVHIDFQMVRTFDNAIGDQPIQPGAHRALLMRKPRRAEKTIPGFLDGMTGGPDFEP